MGMRFKTKEAKEIWKLRCVLSDVEYILKTQKKNKSFETERELLQISRKELEKIIKKKQNIMATQLTHKQVKR